MGMNPPLFFFEKPPRIGRIQDLAADVEIFNTYGEFSNDKLLQDYGFVLVPGLKPHV